MKYIVVPGIAEKQALDYNLKNIQIIANTEELQAVKQNNLNIVQAIFYKAGSLMVDRLQIKVDQPCVLQQKGNKVLSVTNPAQAQKEINVYINSQKTGSKLTKVNIPDKPYNGSNEFRLVWFYEKIFFDGLGSLFTEPLWFFAVAKTKHHCNTF